MDKLLCPVCGTEFESGAVECPNQDCSFPLSGNPTLGQTWDEALAEHRERVVEARRVWLRRKISEVVYPHEALPLEAAAAIQNCYDPLSELLGPTTGCVTQAQPSQRGMTGYFQRCEHGSVYWSLAYGAQPVRHGISAYYQALGETTSLLGFPATPEETAAPSEYGGRGAFQRFEGPREYSRDVTGLLADVRCGATVYWLEEQGAFTTSGAIGEIYEREHGTAGWLGFPTSEELDATPSPRGTQGRFQRYEGGTAYQCRPGAYTVGGAIGAYYEGLGGTGSRLGFPVSPETTAVRSPQGTEGKFQRFEGTWDYPEEMWWRFDRVQCGATIYWSEQHGAHATWAGIGQRYETNEGTGGPLGFPTSDELEAAVSTQGTTGYYQTFEGGAICWCEKYDAHSVYGGIHAEYARLGGTYSLLGFPTSEEEEAAPSPSGTLGRVQCFEGGTIYWTPQFGAHAVYGPVASAYREVAASSSVLGFPRSGPLASLEAGNGAGEWAQEFEGGWLYWNTRNGHVRQVLL